LDVATLPLRPADALGMARTVTTFPCQHFHHGYRDVLHGQIELIEQPLLYTIQWH
jgi:hypothetical protein